MYDPLVNCPIATSDEITIIQTKIAEVYENYTTARCYGVIDNIDKVIADEKKALEDAGLDAYIKHAQKQVDEFMEKYPDAMERCRKEFKAVRKYKKENPHKTNPKDFK